MTGLKWVTQQRQSTSSARLDRLNGVTDAGLTQLTLPFRGAGVNNVFTNYRGDVLPPAEHPVHQAKQAGRSTLDTTTMLVCPG